MSYVMPTQVSMITPHTLWHYAYAFVNTHLLQLRHGGNASVSSSRCKSSPQLVQMYLPFPGFSPHLYSIFQSKLKFQSIKAFRFFFNIAQSQRKLLFGRIVWIVNINFLREWSAYNLYVLSEEVKMKVVEEK